MKKLITIFLASILAFSFVGCSSNGASDSESTKATADENEKILIYSNSAGEGRGEWITSYAKEAGFEIEVVSIPGSELTDRLIIEKNNALADMVFGLNNLEYEKLKKEDLLLKYEPIWSKDVDAKLGDADGYYHPIVIQPLVLVMNNEMQNTPNDWIDLTDDKYKDKYAIYSLNGGTSKVILSSIASRYKDENGEHNISKEGWEIIKKYIQNSHISVEGEDAIGNVIDGSRPMSMLFGSGVVQNQSERNYKFKVMSPEIGVPYVTEQVAILSTSEKAETCKKFMDWFGSADVQAKWSEKFGSIPAHPEALATSPQEVKDFLAKVPTPQVMDWKFISENIDKWIEKIELEIIQ